MEKKYAIGADIGGTNTALALVCDDGVVAMRSALPTAGGTPREYMQALAAEVDRMLSASGVKREEVAGIGMGAPCANFRTGVIEAATNMPWPSPIPLRTLAEKTLRLPVAVSNDANAAAVGEMRYGAARGMTDFIMLTLGTGVGSGVVVDGHLLTGFRGFAGELGHCSIRVHGQGRKCACGRPDCLQAYCSARGVADTGREELRRHGLSAPEALTARDVGEAADRGEQWALETMRRTGEALGRGVADFVTFSAPEAIILFGGLARAFRHFAPAMKLAFRENALGLYADVKFLASTLPEADAALLGAASLITMNNAK